MENVDLSNASPEAVEEIKKILENDRKKYPTNTVTEESNQIREEYLKSIADAKIKVIEGISLDTKDSFEAELRQIRSGYANRVSEGRLNSDDRETYRQLNIIHKDGVPTFWKRVKNVVESREQINEAEISDKIDPNLLK
mgnify:CR=1 FL=1